MTQHQPQDNTEKSIENKTNNDATEFVIKSQLQTNESGKEKVDLSNEQQLQRDISKRHGINPNECVQQQNNNNIINNKDHDLAGVVESAHNLPEKKKFNFEILLNNFQIKKKRYRVLFNCDHIVWERWSDTKQHCQHDQQPQHHDQKQEEKTCSDDIVKDVDSEAEHLSNNNCKIKYGCHSHVVHINEIIRVTKGETKAATLHIAPPQNCCDQFDGKGSPKRSNGNIPTNNVPVLPTEQYLTIHYAERIINSKIDCNRWRVCSLTLYNSDPYIIKKWHETLLQKLNENTQRLHIKRLLVFINPYGGKKEALQTYEKHCKPLFELAGIDASVQISQRANQIQDILMSQDLSLFDAICCVGGDGTVAEAINGLLFRALQDEGLNKRHPAFIPRPRLPIGIIPAGSTDTIAYSSHGTSDPRTAAIHVILGQRRGCDICSVGNAEGIIRFCASVFSYGYLGDVALKSEKYRWMGTKRYEYTGVRAFLSNRGYEAELRILNDESKENLDEEAHTSRSTLNDIKDSTCYANCQKCSTAAISILKENENSEKNGEVVKEGFELRIGSASACEDGSIAEDLSSNGREPTNGVISKQNCDIEKKEFNVENRLNDNSIPTQALERITSSSSFSCNSTITTTTTTGNNNQFNVTPSENKWKIIRGNFFMISGANITCACSRSPNGIARYNHLGDGYLDLIVVRKTSMLNNLRFALNTMGHKGDIRNLPFVEIYKTREFQFKAHIDDVDNGDVVRGSCQPIAENCSGMQNDESISSWNCDGEVVYDLDVLMKSHCQLIDFFMRGPFAYDKQAQSKNKSKICCCG